MYYDTIIIGGGIAGLYAAYKLIKNKKYNFIILEKSNRIGGRIKTELFHGETIVAGAGVGRYEKDTLLKHLLTSLNIPFQLNKSTRYWASNLQQIQKNPQLFVHSLLNNIDLQNNQGTFADVVNSQYGEEVLKKFVTLVGFSDFLKEDFRETILHYGIEDNVDEDGIFYVDWKQLLEKLGNLIEKNRIYTNCNVTQISKQTTDGSYSITTCMGNFKSTHIVVATDILGLRTFFPHNVYYSFIGGQSFCRIYAKFDKNSSKVINKVIKGYTIVQGVLQKIIPIHKQKGIYMIGYSDNFNADYCLKYFKDNVPLLEKYLTSTLGIQLKIEDCKFFYWNIGTHYYKPYYWDFDDWNKYQAEMQNPNKNIYVVGELVSFNQGWVEGALETVENIIG